MPSVLAKYCHTQGGWRRNQGHNPAQGSKLGAETCPNIAMRDAKMRTSCWHVLLRRTCSSSPQWELSGRSMCRRSVRAY